MNPEQAVAFLQSQTAAMLAELEAMKVENQMREAEGKAFAYGPEAFLELPVRYGLDHNSAYSTILGQKLQGAG